MIRSAIYDATFARLTTRWYREVLERVPVGAHMLDVGIGTASALIRNAGILRQRQLHVTGIDIDADYIARGRKNVRSNGLEDRVDLKLESVHSHRGGPYDVAYFSASFMLLDQPEKALRDVGRLLKSGGRILFTQTFSERRSRLMEIAKPMLVKFTTMEFGRVTYEDDFLRTLDEGGLALEDFVVMDRNALQSFRLAIARPRASAPNPLPAQ